MRAYRAAASTESPPSTRSSASIRSAVTGTACHVGGARFILEQLERTLEILEGQTTEDMEYSLETVACIGCCGLAPCISVNDEVSAKLTPKKVRKQFKKARK
jgi:NADH-quinone oxidoreductase subunit E